VACSRNGGLAADRDVGNAETVMDVGRLVGQRYDVIQCSFARRRRNTASLPINDDLRRSRRRRHYTGRHFFSDDDDGRRAMARSGRSAAQRDGARRHNNCSNTSCTGSHRGGLPGSLCVTGHSPSLPLPDTCTLSKNNYYGHLYIDAFSALTLLVGRQEGHQ